MERKPKTIALKELKAAVRIAVQRTQTRYPGAGLPDGELIYFHPRWIMGIPPDWPPIWDGEKALVSAAFSDSLIDELQSAGLADSLEPAAYSAGGFAVIGCTSDSIEFLA
jgi:hypothetical protein